MVSQTKKRCLDGIPLLFNVDGWSKIWPINNIFFVIDVFDGQEWEKTHVQLMCGKNLKSYINYNI
jgi:hypothetical protein